MPCTASGRIGYCPSIAILNAPARNLRISPVLERVPSGKIITDTPDSSRSFDAASAAAPEVESPRVSGMSLTSRIIQPMPGIFMISIFDIHFISVGRCEMSRMSTKLSWLETTT